MDPNISKILKQDIYFGERTKYGPPYSYVWDKRFAGVDTIDESGSNLVLNYLDEKGTRVEQIIIPVDRPIRITKAE